MDFTLTPTTENGDNYEIKEEFTNADGEKETRMIDLTFLRLSKESLLRDLPKVVDYEDRKKMTTTEVIEKRFDLYQKIKENPENVVLTEEEKELLLEIVRLRFECDIIIVAQLIKLLK